MEYPTGFDSSAMSRKPICGVLAVAMCADVSYPVAHATLKQIAYEKGAKRFGGRTHGSWQRLALSRLGVRYTHTRLEYNCTLKNWIMLKAERDVTYLVQVRGHVFVVRNNCITDQSKQLNYMLCPKLCRMQIVSYTRIDGKGW